MYKIIKRLFDIISSSCLLLTISPLMILLAILVSVNVGSPIIFKQERSGKDKKKFRLLKFRTMSNATNEKGELLPDHLRVTKFGVWLRSTSLDELPELFNIIKGDISVIGPRPLPCHYDEYYRPSEMARFNVRGGLISPDVKTGKSVISWDEQLKLESEYGKHLSFAEDFSIFVAVFKTLLQRVEDDHGSYERIALDQERK